MEKTGGEVKAANSQSCIRLSGERPITDKRELFLLYRNRMPVDPRQEIALVNERFMSLVRSGDKTEFARLYTEDAVLMLPNTEALSGRAGAMKFFDGLKARGIAQVQLTTLELEDFGDTAWERGSSLALLSDGTTAGRGKYIVIWKRTGEGWKLHRDIMNQDAPPPVART